MISYLTPTKLYQPPSPRVSIGPALTINRIKQTVAGFYGIDARYMESEQRGKDVARPRQIAMYLTRELTPKSYPNIGRHFGKRDHTTVMHACKRVSELIEGDDSIAAQVEFLKGRLAG